MQPLCCRRSRARGDLGKGEGWDGSPGAEHTGTLGAGKAMTGVGCGCLVLPGREPGQHHKPCSLLAVFIYSMPGYKCSIKERMLYSSCKSRLLDTVEQEFCLEIAKKVSASPPNSDGAETHAGRLQGAVPQPWSSHAGGLRGGGGCPKGGCQDPRELLIPACCSRMQIEIDDGAELTAEFLYEEVHPKQHAFKQAFAKPKGPVGKRGQKRLIKGPGENGEDS